MLPQHWIHARQFFASSLLATPRGLTPVSLFDTLRVNCHPALHWAEAKLDDRHLCLLGELIDPRAPTDTNAQVVSALLERCTTFDQFESEAARLGGRWVALLQIGGEARAYPDAGGTRSLYYLADTAGVHIGTQPGLFVEAGLSSLDLETQTAFFAHEHADSYTLRLTPYRGVRQLVPNHYLDLRTGEEVRFWPREDVPARDVEPTLELVMSLLGGTVAAIAHRGKTTSPLSAGFDSRTLLAVVLKQGLMSQVAFARVSGHHLPFYDTITPRALSKHFGFPLQEARAGRDAPEISQVMEENIVGVMWDPAWHMFPGFAQIPTEFLLLGQLSEIGRVYYKKREGATSLTGVQIATMARYHENSLAAAQFQQWRDGMPPAALPYLLDLLYWEQRIGNWASLIATVLDTFHNVIFPYNSREILVAMLGVDPTVRGKPYLFHQRLCALGSPDLLDYPFNDSWADRALAKAPWKVQQAVGALRRQLS